MFLSGSFRSKGRAETQRIEKGGVGATIRQRLFPDQKDPVPVFGQVEWGLIPPTVVLWDTDRVTS